MEAITLLDPLLNDYKEMPNCAYKNDTFLGKQVTTITSSIEDYNFKDESYDLVVLINVLQHCRDVTIIMDKVWNMLKKNGILVFQENVMINDHPFADEGHPIQISQDFVENQTDRYDRKYKISYDKVHGNHRSDFYFIGEKK
jgi:SAM-dependent methyltransferase